MLYSIISSFHIDYHMACTQAMTLSLSIRGLLIDTRSMVSDSAVYTASMDEDIISLEY